MQPANSDMIKQIQVAAAAAAVVPAGNHAGSLAEASDGTRHAPLVVVLQDAQDR